MRLRHLRPPGADQAGQADDLAGADAERHIRGSRAGLESCSTRSSSSPGVVGWRAGKIVVQAAADHHLDTAALSSVGDRLRGHVAAVAQHGDGVAEPEDLVACGG